VVNYADYRMIYVAVSTGQKIFGFRKKTRHDKLTTPILYMAR